MLQENIKEIGKLKHLTHIEDQVINAGSAGVKQAQQYFYNLLTELEGGSKGQIETSLKIDGAPSITLGTDPETGKFFVATKSLFNKVPKIAYTPADVKRLYADGPTDILIAALQYCSKLGIKGVLQGDFLFSKGSVSTQTIDGTKYYTFTPNTITYAVPVDSDLGRRIGAAKLGIIFHTSYTGKTIQTLKANFGVNLRGLKKSKDVWYDNATVEDLSGSITFTTKESSYLRDAIAALGKISTKYEKVLTDEDISLLNIWINAKIKEGELVDPNKATPDFINFVIDRYKKQIDNLKTDAGKQRKREALDAITKRIKGAESDLKNMFFLHREITEIKLVFLDKLNTIGDMRTFIQQGDDFVVTGQEGFVISDHLKTGALKFVDRLSFSRANFSAPKKWKSGLVEAVLSKKAVMTFGRMNPPTTGHQLLLDKMSAYARAKGADGFVFLSQTQDKKKNPLSFDQKISIVKQMTNLKVSKDTKIRTIFEAVKYLNDKGYKNLTIFAGSDRVSEYESKFQTYINTNHPSLKLEFDSFNVASAGERDPDSDSTAGMSASKMRQFVVDGDKGSFERGLSNKVKNKDLVWNQTKKGLGL